MEHRNPKVSEGRTHVVWVEDNICTYRYGEILHASAVFVETIHVRKGLYVNWRGPAFSFSRVC